MADPTPVVDVLRAVLVSDLPPAQRLLIMIVATLADPETGIVQPEDSPPIPTLAAYAGMHRVTVVRLLATLTNGGWIQRDARTGRVKTLMNPPPYGSRTLPLTGSVRLPYLQSTSMSDDPERKRTATVPTMDVNALSPECRSDTVLEESSKELKNKHRVREADPEDDALFVVEGSQNLHKRPTSAMFDEFWAAYPRRIAKGAARKSWDRVVGSGVDPATVVASAATFAEHCRSTEREARFTPYPATWLNQERWNDELDPVTPAVNGRRSTTDQRVADALQIGARLQAEADRRAAPIRATADTPKALGA